MKDCPSSSTKVLHSVRKRVREVRACLNITILKRELELGIWMFLWRGWSCSNTRPIRWVCIHFCLERKTSLIECLFGLTSAVQMNCYLPYKQLNSMFWYSFTNVKTINDLISDALVFVYPYLCQHVLIMYHLPIC